MPDIFHPSADYEFIKHSAVGSGKLENDGVVEIGSTTTFVLKGPQAIYKRTILIRQLTPTQICFEQATGVALRLGFLGNLMEWYVKYRNWKEGGYIVPPQNDNEQAV